eukprot:CAMPEP_0185845256 /NCGR_PEP_ID=MMETSP1354-20130828/1266_1 /TAXON_ID=708628 /ORGANISM="Erythrolobus madagascarensis, Strain CCMP3276" /LENGTH=229 /DNA_ID=CAMNT_0028545173 /DNA_START=68 /DNA_END=757 /DNA_ORIENTATION=-
MVKHALTLKGRGADYTTLGFPIGVSPDCKGKLLMLSKFTVELSFGSVRACGMKIERAVLSDLMTDAQCEAQEEFEDNEPRNADEDALILDKIFGHGGYPKGQDRVGQVRNHWRQYWCEDQRKKGCRISNCNISDSDRCGIVADCKFVLENSEVFSHGRVGIKASAGFLQRGNNRVFPGEGAGRKEPKGIHGFTEGEEFELACQGVQPWDEDAAAVLGVLNGKYDEYGYH